MIFIQRVVLLCLAFFNALFLPSVIGGCMIVDKQFRITEKTISYLGGGRLTGRAVRKALLVSAPLMLLTFLLVRAWLGVRHKGVDILIWMSFASLVVVPLTFARSRRVPLRRALHNIASVVFITGTTALVISLQWALIPTAKIFGWSGFFLGVLLFLVTGVAFLKSKVTGVPELLFTLLLCSWFLLLGFSVIFV